MTDFYFLPNKGAVTGETAERVREVVAPLGVRFEVINPLYVMNGEGWYSFFTCADQGSEDANMAKVNAVYMALCDAALYPPHLVGRLTHIRRIPPA